VFTNLSQEHLDYHPSMDEYAKAKAKLFSMQAEISTKPYRKTAIINQDDLMAPLMIDSVKGVLLTYGLSKEADLYAKEIKLGSHSTEFILCYAGKEIRVKTNLMGRFNVYNVLAASAVALTRGMSLKQIAHSLSQFTFVPGRMERVENDLDIDIYVDYSHKSEALKNALETCNEVKKGKLILVFGCAGNRDKLKRKKMMAIAKEFADEVIVTSDNPRGEDPLEIIKEVIEGSDLAHVSIEVDRKIAIDKALQMASKNDMILIAGKGHEKKQIFHNLTIEFDDVACVQKAIQSLALRPIFL
jgi:UDP-N-acetylmuramoyl-L-alanyl-D-glutamate--2,6-diaminopimelate ligase